jgi:hypothetical protein
MSDDLGGNPDLLTLDLPLCLVIHPGSPAAHHQSDRCPRCLERSLRSSQSLSTGSENAPVGVAEDLAPGLEAVVAGDDDRAAFVAAGDQGEEQVSARVADGVADRTAQRPAPADSSPVLTS